MTWTVAKPGGEIVSLHRSKRTAEASAFKHRALGPLLVNGSVPEWITQRLLREAKIQRLKEIYG